MHFQNFSSGEWNNKLTRRCMCQKNHKKIWGSCSSYWNFEKSSVMHHRKVVHKEHRCAPQCLQRTNRANTSYCSWMSVIRVMVGGNATHVLITQCLPPLQRHYWRSFPASTGQAQSQIQVQSYHTQNPGLSNKESALLSFRASSSAPLPSNDTPRSGPDAPTVLYRN